MGRGHCASASTKQDLCSGCHNATPTPKIQGATMPNIHTHFLNCHYCGKGALCFRFDLACVIFQGSTIPPLNTKKIGIVIIVGRGIMLLLRLSQGISSGWHHATPKPQKNFWICHYCGKGHYASASTWPRYFFRVTLCHPYTQKILIIQDCWKGHYPASTYPRISSGCHHTTPTPQKIFRFVIIERRWHYPSAST